MTAALKMAAPGELCAQSIKLMEFCKVQARSIKAMRQHLGVTHERIGDLLGEMLAKKLLWRQHNGQYKTVTNALQYGQTEQQADNSLLALADDAEQAKYDAVGNELDANEEADNLPYRVAAAKETVAVASQSEVPEHTPDLPETYVLETTISSLGGGLLRHSDGTIFGPYVHNENFASINLTCSEFAPKPYDLEAMAAEFEAEQERGDTHKVDNITAKQRAINYCQMLLSPNSTELRRCLDELQMDLAVIALQQERSA